MPIFEKIDSVVYYTNLRDSNIKANKYKAALLYSQKTISYLNKNNAIEDEAKAIFNLGKIYFDLKKYDEALNSFNKSVYLSRSFKPDSIKVSVYYYMGKCYMNKENYDKAKIFYNHAESLNQSLNIAAFSDLIILEKGNLFLENGDRNSARNIYDAILSKPDNPIILDTKAEALYQIGKIEMAENRNNEAIDFFKKALEYNSKSNNFTQRSSIFVGLSNVYDILLDKNNTNYYLKQNEKLKKYIPYLENEKLLVKGNANFDLSDETLGLEKFKQENNNQEKNNKFSKLISILAIALISILSLLSLALYKNNIIRKQSNSLLEEKNIELVTAKDNAIKASNARSEFLSNVSHELRTPLNAINGISYLLLAENPKESQLKYLESLQFSGNYLTNFINDILEINKIDSNNAQVENISFNLKELFKNIHNSLKELAHVNNNKFIIDIDPKIPDFLIGDPTKLSQILLNLINNALKFTSNGKVIFKINLLLLEDNKAQLFFEVTDTGIGIPEDKLELVFDSFSQGSVGINRKYGGTGLGLTIVKKLVEILGGEIKVKSVVNKGTSFTFHLPFEVSENPVQSEVKKENSQSKLFGKKILIIEDNLINQMVSKKMLQIKGVICEIVDNGEDAIEYAKFNTYDLLLMDVHLPGINGTVSAKRIREFDKITPIIALTAISLNENRKDILSFGINDVITKPFVPEEFYDIISKYI